MYLVLDIIFIEFNFYIWIIGFDDNDFDIFGCDRIECV